MEQKRNDNTFRNLLRKDEAGMTIFLVGLCLLVGLFNNSFFLLTNIINILRTSALTILVGVGLTYVLISGHIDLSLGSTIGLGGMVTGILIFDGWPIWIGILCGIAAGGLVGVFNGIIIAYFKIPPLIVTLGSMYIVRGVVHVISGGRTIYPFPPAFIALGGRGGFLGIPVMVWFTLLICVAASIVLKRTVFGRCIYAIGGNKETARLSGIKVNKFIVLAYIMTGCLAASSGIFQAARVNSAIANAGTGWELTVMAAVIIGGTSMFGGVGSIFGTVVGALVLTVLTNGMVMLSINAYWQSIVSGGIIIAAVGMDQYKRLRINNRKQKVKNVSPQAGR